MSSPKGRRLRPKDAVSYEESEDSQLDTPGGSSAFSSAGSSRRRNVIDLESSSEEEAPETPKTPPPRVSFAGHSLRQHAVLHQPLRALENADKPETNSRKKRRTTGSSRAVPRVRSDLTPKGTPRSSRVKTERAEVREAIAAETRVSRSAFFVAKKDIFLPLLPERNHVSKLVAQSTEEGAAPLKPIVEYEELTEQPKG